MSMFRAKGLEARVPPEANLARIIREMVGEGFLIKHGSKRDAYHEVVTLSMNPEPCKRYVPRYNGI